MLKKNHLFLIGEISKISGVGVKALKYYEKIGILKPAFIDPHTLYRYYSYRQLYFIELIHYCVELGIPLKEINQYIDDKENIDYTSLLAYGKKMSKQKIKQLQRGLDFIQVFEEELLRSETYGKTGESYTLTLPEKTYYVIAYDLTQTEEEKEMLFLNLLKEGGTLNQTSLSFFEYGILHEHTQNQVKSYLFIELTADVPDLPCIKRIPAGTYLCHLSDNSQINQAKTLFKDILEAQDQNLIIESEVYANNNKYDELKKEIRIRLMD